MNPLSEAIRQLMQHQKLTGAKLAEEIGISPTSVSQILTGKTKPRQVTLYRIMKRLCVKKEDEQVLLSAYESLGGVKMPVTPVVNGKENVATEEERVRRFLEMKAKSISFRKEVALKLYETKLRFQSEYTRGAITTDFLIEDKSKRVALECRANVKRDLEKSLVSARLIRDELKCEQVYIVVPQHDRDLGDACKKENCVRDLELAHLTDELTESFELS